MIHRAWTTVDLPIDTGDTFDFEMPDRAWPKTVVVDHEQRKVLLQSSPQFKPVVRLVFEVDTGAPANKRMRRFIVVPKHTAFVVEDCDLVCFFVDPFRDMRVALYEVAVPKTAAAEEVPTSNDLPAVSGEIVETMPKTCSRCGEPTPHTGPCIPLGEQPHPSQVFRGDVP